MIVLSRRPTEAIRVADDIRIVVFRTSSGRVSLGIEAPPGIRIEREEIWKRRAAAAVGQADLMRFEAVEL
jgi:carbon storage regulator